MGRLAKVVYDRVRQNGNCCCDKWSVRQLLHPCGSVPPRGPSFIRSLPHGYFGISMPSSDLLNMKWDTNLVLVPINSAAETSSFTYSTGKSMVRKQWSKVGLLKCRTCGESTAITAILFRLLADQMTFQDGCVPRRAKSIL